MDEPTLTCQVERRRQVVRARGAYGIDYVEVIDDQDQRTLCVHFFGAVPDTLEKGNVVIKGGRRIRNIRVLQVEIEHASDPTLDDCLRVFVDRAGDFSTYTLCLVEAKNGVPTDEPHHDFDPRYACVEFSFKVGCPSDFDCAPGEVCPPQLRAEPEINYLAKDYASFRQLILDRLALIMPDWQERHVPDIGITLVELLAYVGDYLSYYQDAVATEAYLDTARQRISVRRHARLVDYQLHEGCNARAWLCLATDTDMPLDAPEIFFITACKELGARSGGILRADDLHNIPASHYEVFEPLVEKDRVWFLPGDLKDPGGWVASLRDAPDPLTQYLHRRLSPEARRWVEAYAGTPIPPAQLQKYVIDEMNRLLSSSSLYDPKLLSSTALRPETQALLKQNPHGESLVRLNRMLVEDAYPDEIVQADQIYLVAAHSTINFYTWGDEACCLPRGATQATLLDGWEPVSAPQIGTPAQVSYARTARQYKAPAPPPPTPLPPAPKRKLHLQVGDILIFEEVLGPRTGAAADADPRHRQAVRLTRVEPGEDPLYTVKVAALDDELPTPVVEIEWAVEDALEFPLCLSATLPAPDCTLVEAVSVAHGNVILVDHGRRVADPPSRVPTKTTAGECECDGSVEVTTLPGAFAPILEATPLTFSQPLDFNSPASQRLAQDPRRALPQVTLTGLPPVVGQVLDAQDPGFTWYPRPDLLASTGDDQAFVVEVDDEGRAHVRLGDGELGKQAAAGTLFTPHYRVGNGPAGNVGAETIAYLVLRSGTLSGVDIRPRNPFPAQGGLAAEPLAEAKLFAPRAFRKVLQRAITADDYARLAASDARLQGAAAVLSWTGSWYEAQVAIDPLGGEEADDALLRALKGHLYRYRRLGYDLRVVPAHYVPLEVELKVCVLPNFLRGHVEAALLERFSPRIMANGQPGFFHPDNLTFGAGVTLSSIVAAAQAVPGVVSVAVTTLKRFGEPARDEVEKGILPLGPMEIAQLDNDPSFPEHGKLTLVMEGGR